MKVLITGAKGLVGTAMRDHCIASGDDVFAYGRSELDISDAESVDRIVDEVRPDALINCAAWTDVDGCESDPERAQRVNAIGPENLALAARNIGATLVTISTDYVFDGTKEGFYTQDDVPSPQSVYGRAKLEGEQRVLAEYPSATIVRTGFIFGMKGKNFLSRVVELSQQGKRFAAISDAKGTPTYGRDLAGRLRELAERKLSGIFHVVNAGDGATYEEFARTALRLVGLDDSNLDVVPMASLNRPAPRPINSRLRCLLSERCGLQPLPNWQNGLQRFVEECLQNRER